MANFDLNETDRLLTTTRAVRKRLDLERPVPREVVLDALRVAIQAPTGGNSQRWRWVVVDDPEVRASLAALYRKRAEPYMNAPGVQPSRVLDSSRYLTQHMHEVPVLVIPCILDRLPANASNEAIAGFYGSILPAVWSFQLALHSRGLGSVFTTLHLAYERDASEPARHPGHGDAGRAHSGCVHDRRRLQARRAAPGRRDRVLRRLEEEVDLCAVGDDGRDPAKPFA